MPRDEALELPEVVHIAGTGAPGNQPGSRGGASAWTDATGHLWMFGGQGVSPGGSPGGDMNDLWKY